MFVEICKMIFELYSKSFFKNWFYEHLINLSNDEVTNVKLAFVKILPKLKKLWNMYDREKLDVIEKILANLLHDKDKDVIELTEKVIFYDSFKIYTIYNYHIFEDYITIRSNQTLFVFGNYIKRYKINLYFIKFNFKNRMI
jgi:hypothetical protein